MGIDHSNPYIHSTTVLCDIYIYIYVYSIYQSTVQSVSPNTATLGVMGTEKLSGLYDLLQRVIDALYSGEDVPV